jgi:hypothetical protein
MLRRRFGDLLVWAFGSPGDVAVPLVETREQKLRSAQARFRFSVSGITPGAQ